MTIADDSRKRYMLAIMFGCRRVVFAVAIGVLATNGTPLTGQTKISGATTETSDEAFASYQRVTPGMTPPKAIHAPDPPYPDLPVDTEPNGVVVMLVGVNNRGHVGPVHVVRSSAQAFEKSAVDTVKTWKFKPAKKDGKPVPVQITVEMKFSK
jgi:TonB family protein